MVNTEIRTYKELMILSMVFFIGFGLIGVLPSVLMEETIWEKSTLLTVIGVIIGFILFVSMLSLIFLAIKTIKPYRTVTNYLKIIQVVMLIFLFDTILPDEILVNELLRIIIFGSLGLIIVSSNIVCYIKSKSLTEESITKHWDNNYKENKKAITNDTDGVYLFNTYTFFIMAILLVNFDSSSISAFSVIVLMNSYVLYKYFKTTKCPRKQIYIYSAISIVLSILTIILLINIKEAITVHVAIQAILFTLPSIYIFPSILKNYYQIAWRQSYESINQLK
jgi:hypothetical protein